MCTLQYVLRTCLTVINFHETVINFLQYSCICARAVHKAVCNYVQACASVFMKSSKMFANGIAKPHTCSGFTAKLADETEQWLHYMYGTLHKKLCEPLAICSRFFASAPVREVFASFMNGFFANIRRVCLHEWLLRTAREGSNASRSTYINNSRPLREGQFAKQCPG